MSYKSKNFDPFLKRIPKQENLLTADRELGSQQRLYETKLGAGGSFQPSDSENMLSHSRIHNATLQGRISGEAAYSITTLSGSVLSLNGGETFVTSVGATTGSESSHTHAYASTTQLYSDNETGALYTSSVVAQRIRSAKYAYGQYDFATDGGTIGTIALMASGTIPDNSVILGAWYRVRTTATSATDAATIALQIEAAGDLVTAIAISDGTNPWDAAGWVECSSHVEDSTTFIETTAAQALNLVIAVENLTAGVIDVLVQFLCLDANMTSAGYLPGTTATSAGSAHTHSVTVGVATKYLVKYTP